MTKDEDLLVSKLKPYHIILFSCLLCSVLIINSNNVNEKRAQIKLSKEKTQAYEEIMALRRLEGESNSDKVCKKGSDDLVKYYQTGDLSLIDLEEGAIKCEDKDASYMKALRGLARSLLGDSDSSSNSEDADEGHLRNLDEGDSDKDNIMQYLNRILPIGIFLGIGILSFPGWIGCCIFNCCDCCCCCCCKKRKCKIPCFIVAYVFYALVVAISIYGLVESNKIFKGIANTECSMLKFLEQVVYGEIKQTSPRWAGITGISNILKGLIDKFKSFSPSTSSTLNGKINAIETPRNDFLGLMKSGKNLFYYSATSPSYRASFLTTGTYTSSNLKILSSPEKEITGQYTIDLVNNFGECTGTTRLTCTPATSVLYAWNEEYSAIASDADDYMDIAKESFSNVFYNLGPIITSLEEANQTLNDFSEPFDDINSEIGGTLSDYSDKIDDYGKLVVKIVFSFLLVMNIALAVLMTLIGLFSMKACVDCCFCRCLFKSCVHILWNVLALMMILSFLVGSILALVGRVGGDVMSLASYIFSQDNLNAANPLFVGEMGEEGLNYLKRCFLLDGDIAAELNIDGQIGSLDDLSRIEANITSVFNTFNTLLNSFPTYIIYKDQMKARNDLTTDFYLYSTDSTCSPFGFDELVDTFNDKIKTAYSSNPDTWSRTGANNNCQVGQPNGKTDLNLRQCVPKTMYASETADFKNYADFIYDIKTLVTNLNAAHDPPQDPPTSFIDVLDKLKGEYKTYLTKYIDVLQYMKDTIGVIMDQVRDFTIPGKAFSFLNGHFILTNLKILLKYLKSSLGKDLYTVGVMLIVVGCSLILSISITILLIVIINIGLKEDMEMKKNVMTQSPGVAVSNYQVNTPDMKPIPQY